ncbi:metal ABC transporter solute-binding protein, Zn/Mn family [Paenisporosarcina antarctica]|uniref:Metal ABC transporter substrate-binding protein n=1 Tax=Paenisporosarcina antarctica TaxID=417367 RepID=A0A4P6ZY49_9BACL|nr:zinc ABC transporter substrate-binding protein [Paenisporosarcina antarctica]QBP41411.1 metal ABC transporter substrate-binding protein [Paenisporosarcina antarctica]
MKTIKYVTGIMSIILLLLISACGKDDENANKDPNEQIHVIATYSIIYDIVKNVGGDRVEIHTLAPVGSNPHEYDPLPKDVQLTTDADAVFYNGLNLEAGNSWFEKLLLTANKGEKDSPVFQMSEGVQPKYLTTKGKESEEDPHAWLDIRNGIKYAENARDGLIKVDPEHADVYEKNAKAYIEKLETLHQESVTRYNEIPKEQRLLITSEGAFKYFSEAYDFDAAYIWEINAENQGSPDQVKSVVDFINTKKDAVLFVETSIDPRSMETVSAETGVPIYGKVFTDSIGKPGEDGDTYIKMMEWNIDTIFKGLTEK